METEGFLEIISGMVRPKKAGGQLKVTLPKSVVAHVDKRHRREGWDRTRQALAGFIAFEALDRMERQTVIQRATAVALGEVDWSTLVEELEKEKDLPLDKEWGWEVLRSLIRHQDKTRPEHRRAQNQPDGGAVGARQQGPRRGRS